jgi:hypothetical protein
MVRFARRKEREVRPHPEGEDPVVRQYRFLLRQAPPDAVEAAHAEALTHVGDEERRVLLPAVQRGLLAGDRLQPDDTSQLAHLIVVGERRAPSAFLSTCPHDTLVTLAEAVLASEATLGLLGPYAAWDGADPPVDADDDDFRPRGGWNSAGSPSKDGAGGYPGGYPGGRLPGTTGGH